MTRTGIKSLAIERRRGIVDWVRPRMHSMSRGTMKATYWRLIEIASGGINRRGFIGTLGCIRMRGISHWSANAEGVERCTVGC